MQDCELDDYLSCFVDAYASEVAVNYQVTHEQAVKLARAEIAKDLCDGVNTKGECLFCIENSAGDVQNHIGYVWYKREEDSDRIFICDFHVLPSYQNQGFGKLALAALDKHLLDLGVSQIRLRVAMENRVALHVYESSGFRATGISMYREIRDNSRSE